MIFDASNQKLPLKLKVGLCVIGSGAGGAAAAMVAAESGMDVLIIEAGPFVPPGVMNQREEDMIPALLEANGGQTSSDRNCMIVQGRALGGSTLHNINLCKRIPEPILKEWQRERGMEHLGLETWSALYDEVESLLQVSQIPESQMSKHNQIFRDGTTKLGWKGGLLSHNRSGCVESGFCAVGCAYDAKNNAVKVMVPRILAAGAQILTHCKAVKLIQERGRVVGVDARALDPLTRKPIGRVEIQCEQVCVSGSATGSAALLLRSKIKDDSGSTGKGLTIHPALVAAGEFDEPIDAWKGIPQSWECSQFLDFERAHAEQPSTEIGIRTWVIPAFAHPMSTATILPGWGDAHAELMQKYSRLAVLTGMIHDTSQGAVTPRQELEQRIDWKPNKSDRAELLFGLKKSAEILFAAGAKRVFVPSKKLLVLDSPADLDRVDQIRLEAGEMPMTAVHPMSTVSMADDPLKGPVDSRGKHHFIEGLWVADGSVFPGSIGVPPQVSIYALGLHVGRAIAAQTTS